MTCVVYRDGVLAGDGRMCCGDVIESDSIKKVFKLPDGSLCGGAGEFVNVWYLIRALKQASRKEKVLPTGFKGIDAIFVEPSGVVNLYEKGNWFPIDLPYVAIGSGHKVASGALEMGATAEEAVRIATKKVTSCGGRIRKVSL